MKVVIIHGIADDKFDKNFDKYWMSWIKGKLEEENIMVIKPLMLDAWNPDYSLWKDEFEKIEIDEDDILIGHSAGCAFLTRWLGEVGKKVKKIIFVAPWIVPSAEFSLGENEMYDFKINRKVGKNAEVVIFTSNDSEKDGKRSVKILHDFLGGEVVELNGCGHFASDMGRVEFPELIDKIMS